MSHTSGIPVSEDLLEAFKDARQSNAVRAFKAQIENDTVALKDTFPLTENLKADFDMLASHAHTGEPCYFIVRLDSENSSGFEWVLLSFVPDTCKVRQRMLYGSTQEGIKTQLGASCFVGELHLSLVSEINFESYVEWKKGKCKNPEELAKFMTDEERYMKAEVYMEVGSAGTALSSAGIKFPLEDAAVQKIKDFAAGSIDYVSLGIDIAAEKIILADEAASLQGEELSGRLHSEEPRFTFFRFKYDHEGSATENIVFVYSCPPKSKVKTRMIYSTTKGSIIAYGEAAGIKAAKNIEVTDLADISSSIIYETLHPVKVEKKTFAKPVRPGKGSARITKPTN